MLDVCAGYAEGASSLLPDGYPNHGNYSRAEAAPVENPSDSAGWHAMPSQSGPKTRRTRRMDLWREGELVKVELGFQDSGANPEGGRTAIHEYLVHAEIDAAAGVLTALQALPLVLPYRECPGASIKATRMIGQKVRGFRQSVLETLPSTLGCTHLNDVLRTLADIPRLAQSLPSV
jgi:hypothetical protein